MARRFSKQHHAHESRYLSNSSAASSAEGSLKSALNSCGGISSFSSDIFNHLSSSGSEASHAAPVRQYFAKKSKDDVDCAEHKMNSPSDPLVVKLTSYQTRGWISRGDYMHYRKLLKTKEQRQKVQTLLTDIAATHQVAASDAAAPSSGLFKGSNASSATSTSSALIAAARRLQVSWDDHSKASSTDVSDKENAKDRSMGPPAPRIVPALQQAFKPTPENPRPPRSNMVAAAVSKPPDITNAMLLEPSHLWKGHAPLDEKNLQKLFVDMCFFARLGFVQPPSCLKCAYSQVVAGHAPQHKPNCLRWVIWRKDANIQLHPNKLEGNIVILQCHAVNALLEGKQVEGRAWNADSRRLVRTH
ncbi:hypothetical protein MPSEU_000702200 [Mayamaea pseudoterrestris]|nr:hypothetical protein MPSEU_000702200 [Mayamaea pseudoterrestris]